MFFLHHDKISDTTFLQYYGKSRKELGITYVSTQEDNEIYCNSVSRYISGTERCNQNSTQKPNIRGI